jgi:hypothetical protein
MLSLITLQLEISFLYIAHNEGLFSLQRRKFIVYSYVQDSFSANV